MLKRKTAKVFLCLVFLMLTAFLSWWKKGWIVSTVSKKEENKRLD